MSGEAGCEVGSEQEQRWCVSKHTLEDLVVLKIGIFGIYIELHSRHRHILYGTLAVYSTRAILKDLRNMLS